MVAAEEFCNQLPLTQRQQGRENSLIILANSGETKNKRGGCMPTCLLGGSAGLIDFLMGS